MSSICWEKKISSFVIYPFDITKLSGYLYDVNLDYYSDSYIEFNKELNNDIKSYLFPEGIVVNLQYSENFLDSIGLGMDSWLHIINQCELNDLDILYLCSSDIWFLLDFDNLYKSFYDKDKYEGLYNFDTSPDLILFNGNPNKYKLRNKNIYLDSNYDFIFTTYSDLSIPFTCCSIYDDLDINRKLLDKIYSDFININVFNLENYYYEFRKRKYEKYKE